MINNYFFWWEINIYFIWFWSNTLVTFEDISLAMYRIKSGIKKTVRMKSDGILLHSFSDCYRIYTMFYFSIAIDRHIYRNYWDVTSTLRKISHSTLVHSKKGESLKVALQLSERLLLHFLRTVMQRWAKRIDEAVAREEK